MSAECGDWQREISVSLPYGKQELWSGAGVGVTVVAGIDRHFTSTQEYASVLSNSRLD